MFSGYHLSSYRTHDPAITGVLVREVIRQVQFWENSLDLSDLQKQQTLILAHTSMRKESDGVEVTVYALVPLDDAHPNFPAIWDGILKETLDKDITLKLEQAGI